MSASIPRQAAPVANRARPRVPLGGRVRRWLLGISTDEVNLARRGFTSADERARERLEHIGRSFLAGYHHGLESATLAELACRLDSVTAESRGFAYEGAAMALSLLDALLPWRSRWRAFVEGPGDAHSYMVHVGAGWAAARLGRNLDRAMTRSDEAWRWLVAEGAGFHEAYFRPAVAAVRGERPRRLSGYAARAFDQGVGRCLWFVGGADVSRIAGLVRGLARGRHNDLWSGVGLAAAYAGGVDDGHLEVLRDASGEFAPCVAQGAAFAAQARQRADNPAPHTQRACAILCGMSAAEAARLTEECLAAARRAPGDSSAAGTPVFERWRVELQTRLASAPCGARRTVDPGKGERLG